MGHRGVGAVAPGCSRRGSAKEPHQKYFTTNDHDSEQQTFDIMAYLALMFFLSFHVYNSNSISAHVDGPARRCHSRPIDRRAVYRATRVRSTSPSGAVNTRPPLSLFISHSPTVAVPWRKNPEFGIKFQREVPYFGDILIGYP